MTTTSRSHRRIVATLPQLQEHTRLVESQSALLTGSAQGKWTELGDLLFELYSQLQHQKQVTVYRREKSLSPSRKSRE